MLVIENYYECLKHNFLLLRNLFLKCMNCFQRQNRRTKLSEKRKLSGKKDIPTKYLSEPTSGRKVLALPVLRGTAAAIPFKPVLINQDIKLGAADAGYLAGPGNIPVGRVQQVVQIPFFVHSLKLSPGRK